MTVERDLITLDQAKKQCRVDHDLDDEELEEMITAASVAILDYIGDAADPFTDTSGNVLDIEVPADIRMACKRLVDDFYTNRGAHKQENQVPDQYGYGYLPAPVTALLSRYRTPTLA